ncbi:dehydrogenase with different specificitie [Ilyonectria sp. MPI-CAGE-AT-0026]|nr:dehydrogenase with different specificitie [Ilyonectria sp. MPI-CAGE-AT-0026]
MTALESKTIVLITGANTGLGFEVTKALFLRPTPYHVFVGCRGDISRASDAIATLQQLFPNSTSTAEPLSIDIASDESITAAVERVRAKIGRVDILVNNAGVAHDQAISSGRIKPREGWNQTYDVNVTGTYLFTHAIAPLLLASKAHPPRLLFITSGLSSVTEHAAGTSHGYALAPAGDGIKPASRWLAYRVSKSAMNLVMVEWARLLKNDGVAVFNISPGFLATGLGDDKDTGDQIDKGALGAIDPDVGAAFCADVIEGKRDEEAWPPKVLRRDHLQPW